MNIRIAKSLETLRGQIDALSPNRDKAHDGSIFDALHKAKLDTPFLRYRDVIRGLDIGNDPGHGIDGRAIAEALRVAQDKRLRFVITGGDIFYGAVRNDDGEYVSETPRRPMWEWKPYPGKDKHLDCVYIAVKDEPRYFDDASAWDLSALAIDPAAASREPNTVDVVWLEKGAEGDAVKLLQKRLNAAGAELLRDGKLGPKTEAAVIAFQKRQGITVDGVVGTETWGVLTTRPARA